MGLTALLLTVAGSLLPIGAALDTAFRSAAKTRLADWLNDAISRPASRLNLSSTVFDRIFGRRLWGMKSFLVSLALALGGLVTTMAITATLSEPARELMWTYLIEEQSAVGFACLAIVLAIVILFDYISYTQTRLFIRSTENISGASTSIVFVLADIIASIAIFIAGFSIARVLCMMIIAHFSLGEPVENTEIFSPALVEHAIISEGIDRDVAFATMSSNEPDIALLALSMGFTEQNAEERLQIFADLSLQSDLGLEELTKVRFPYAEYTAELKCPRTIASFSMSNESALEVLAGSVAKFGYGAVRIKSYREKLETDAAAYIDKVALGMEQHMQEMLGRSQSSCPLPIIQINQSINYRDALGGTSLFDLYLSSLLSTTWEVGQTIPYKMSTYHVMSLSGTYRDFLENSYEIGSRSPFGLSRPDAAKLNMSEFFGRGRLQDPPKVYIPMSSLATTAMISSILFLLVISARLVMWSAAQLRLALSRIFPLVELEKYPFSIAFGTVALLLFLAAILVFVTGTVWAWIWTAIA